MKKRGRLLLINPFGKVKSGLTASEDSKFPPLGLGIIAALTPPDYEVIVIDENYDKFEYTTADLVGITAFTSAATRAYEIAGIYRRQGIPVILGGIHASMMPDEATAYVDTVVIGEAEEIWPRLIEDFEAGRLKRRYTGTHGDLSDLVIPRRDLFHPDYRFATIQTSRGCPMNCNFCSVTVFNGRKYRMRPVGDILDELETIEQRFLFFIDDNIIGYGSEAEVRALELFRGMVRRRMKKSWFCQASLNFGSNPEVLKWAAKSGCKMVFLGLEAVDEKELEGMNKNLNLKLEYKQAFKNIHKAGISVLGAFIFGSDTDTSESISAKADYILDNPIDVIQVTTLTPLPGTDLFKRLSRQGRLLYTNFPADWVHYDMTELTFEPERIDCTIFAAANTNSQKRLLSKSVLLRKFIGTLFRTRSLETAIWSLSSNLVYRKAFKCGQNQLKAQSPGRSSQSSLSEMR